MIRKLFVLSVCLLLAVSGNCQDLEIKLDVPLLRGQVYQKAAGDHLFSISAGSIELKPGSTILTGVDGVVFLNIGPKTELRLREEAAVAVNSSASFEIRKGTAGIFAGFSPVEVTTPHLRITLKNTLVVIKVNPMITRVCALKGQVLVWQGRNTEKLMFNSGHEIAAAQGQISKVYPSTDDLRYTWYWNSPDKEPSLQ